MLLSRQKAPYKYHALCVRNRLKCYLTKWLKVIIFQILELGEFHQIILYTRTNYISHHWCQTWPNHLYVPNLNICKCILRLLSPSIWALFKGAEVQLVLMSLCFCPGGRNLTHNCCTLRPCLIRSWLQHCNQVKEQRWLNGSMAWKNPYNLWSGGEGQFFRSISIFTFLLHTVLLKSVHP